MNEDPATDIVTSGRLVRLLWLAAGLFMTLLAVIGAILPVMPTVVFLIAAAACFSRCSPKLEAMILEHKQFGPIVRDWRERRAIPKRGKVAALLGMSGGYAIFLFTIRPDPLIGAGVALMFILIAIYIVSRPS